MVRIVCLMPLPVRDDWTGRQRIAGKHTGHETTTERYERFHLCRRTRRTEYWRLQYGGSNPFSKIDVGASSRPGMDRGMTPGHGIRGTIPTTPGSSTDTSSRRPCLTMTMTRCPPNISPNGCFGKGVGELTDIDLTVEEGIRQLTTLCATQLHVSGNGPRHRRERYL